MTPRLFILLMALHALVTTLIIQFMFMEKISNKIGRKGSQRWKIKPMKFKEL